MSIIEQIFINWIYNPFLSILKFFVNNTDAFYVLIAVFFVTIFFSGKSKGAEKIKNKYLVQLINFLGVFSLILIVLAGYFRYAPAISDYINKHGSSTNTNSNSSTKNSSGTSGTKNNSQQNTAPAPTYQAPKQLYYSVSCSSCWAEDCNHNGYSYSGYSEVLYYQNKQYCQICNCNDLKSQSFWR